MFYIFLRLAAVPWPAHHATAPDPVPLILAALILHACGECVVLGSHGSCGAPPALRGSGWVVCVLSVSLALSFILSSVLRVRSGCVPRNFVGVWLRIWRWTVDMKPLLLLYNTKSIG
jgi:hypothetical protein